MFKIRSVPMNTCSDSLNPNETYGYLSYSNSLRYVEPVPYDRNISDTCYDEPMDSLKPYIARNFSDTAISPYDPSVDVAKLHNQTVGLTQFTTAQRYFRWTLNNTSTRVWWQRPTLRQIIANPDVKWGVPIDRVVETPNRDEWINLFIDNHLQVDHPIHLHGHDFYILAQGVGPWNGTVATQNPPRRDTALLLGGGHLVIRWKTDNPGTWLMHCHIGWHTEEGFVLQFIERQKEITPLIDQRTLNDTCDTWVASKIIQAEDDSGI